jgi:hypothetical protein
MIQDLALIFFDISISLDVNHIGGNSNIVAKKINKIIFEQ